MSSHNLPVAPRSVLSFRRYFAEATFHFQFFQILIFREANTKTSALHAAILCSHSFTKFYLYLKNLVKSMR